eukprot:TRINITY_DN73675_c0_g1_i1.p1 TRINITY_DN73675_c0_g1~~TRINITY_DN73675_c0_g1_i1.p1  ORF type:complete len:1604 (+),score=301.44 TRINITY_DN73675_c0_g1_i1:327-4814(+)
MEAQSAAIARFRHELFEPSVVDFGDDTAIGADGARQKAAHEARALRAEIHDAHRHAEAISAGCDARAFHCHLIKDELKMLRSGTSSSSVRNDITNSIGASVFASLNGQLPPPPLLKDTIRDLVPPWNDRCVDALLCSMQRDSGDAAPRNDIRGASPSANNDGVAVVPPADVRSSPTPALDAVFESVAPVSLGPARADCRKNNSNGSPKVTSSFERVSQCRDSSLPLWTLGLAAPAGPVCTEIEWEHKSEEDLWAKLGDEVASCLPSIQAADPTGLYTESPPVTPPSVSRLAQDVFTTPPRDGRRTPDDRCLTGSPWPPRWGDCPLDGQLSFSKARRHEEKQSFEGDKHGLNAQKDCLHVVAAEEADEEVKKQEQQEKVDLGNAMHSDAAGGTDQIGPQLLAEIAMRQKGKYLFCEAEEAGKVKRAEELEEVEDQWDKLDYVAPKVDVEMVAKEADMEENRGVKESPWLEHVKTFDAKAEKQDEMRGPTEMQGGESSEEQATATSLLRAGLLAGSTSAHRSCSFSSSGFSDHDALAESCEHIGASRCTYGKKARDSLGGSVTPTSVVGRSSEGHPTYKVAPSRNDQSSFEIQNDLRDFSRAADASSPSRLDHGPCRLDPQDLSGSIDHFNGDMSSGAIGLGRVTPFQGATTRCGVSVPPRLEEVRPWMDYLPPVSPSASSRPTHAAAAFAKGHRICEHDRDFLPTGTEGSRSESVVPCSSISNQNIDYKGELPCGTGDLRFHSQLERCNAPRIASTGGSTESDGREISYQLMGARKNPNFVGAWVGGGVVGSCEDRASVSESLMSCERVQGARKSRLKKCQPRWCNCRVKRTKAKTHTSFSFERAGLLAEIRERDEELEQVLAFRRKCPAPQIESSTTNSAMSEVTEACQPKGVLSYEGRDHETEEVQALRRRCAELTAHSAEQTRTLAEMERQLWTSCFHEEVAEQEASEVHSIRQRCSELAELAAQTTRNVTSTQLAYRAECLRDVQNVEQFAEESVEEARAFALQQERAAERSRCRFEQEATRAKSVATEQVAAAVAEVAALRSELVAERSAFSDALEMECRKAVRASEQAFRGLRQRSEALDEEEMVCSRRCRFLEDELTACRHIRKEHLGPACSDEVRQWTAAFPRREAIGSASRASLGVGTRAHRALDDKVDYGGGDVSLARAAEKGEVDFQFLKAQETDTGQDDDKKEAEEEANERRALVQHSGGISKISEDVRTISEKGAVGVPAGVRERALRDHVADLKRQLVDLGRLGSAAVAFVDDEEEDDCHGNGAVRPDVGAAACDTLAARVARRRFDSFRGVTTGLALVKGNQSQRDFRKGCQKGHPRKAEQQDEAHHIPESTAPPTISTENHCWTSTSSLRGRQRAKREGLSLSSPTGGSLVAPAPCGKMSALPSVLAAAKAEADVATASTGVINAETMSTVAAAARPGGRDRHRHVGAWAAAAAVAGANARARRTLATRSSSESSLERLVLDGRNSLPPRRRLRDQPAET